VIEDCKAKAQAVQELFVEQFEQNEFPKRMAISNRIGALRALIKKIKEFTDPSH
jgi:hypothetical protein